MRALINLIARLAVASLARALRGQDWLGVGVARNLCRVFHTDACSTV